MGGWIGLNHVVSGSLMGKTAFSSLSFEFLWCQLNTFSFCYWLFGKWPVRVLCAFFLFLLGCVSFCYLRAVPVKDSSPSLPHTRGHHIYFSQFLIFLFTGDFPCLFVFVAVCKFWTCYVAKFIKFSFMVSGFGVSKAQGNFYHSEIS